MNDLKSIITIILLVVIAVFAFTIRVLLIAGELPYVNNGDEPHVTVSALRILKTGDFNPYFFSYPSLPIYLTTAGFTLGYLYSCSSGILNRTDQIESVDYPYYRTVEVVIPARLLFAALSVLALVFSGVIAYKLFNMKALLFLVPLVLSVSVQFLTMSWKYINVDIAGAFFIMLVFCSLISYQKNKNIFHRAVLPGLLCGFTIACKYNLGLIVLPCLLSILIYDRRKILTSSLVFLMFVAVGFLVTVPYAILDFNHFINSVGGELSHYAGGHPGRTAESGLPHLWLNLNQIIGDFGWISILFVAFGAVAMFAADWRRSMILLSFPVAHILAMSLPRTHFMRNLVSIFIFYSILVAVGIIASSRFAVSRLGRTHFFANRPLVTNLTVYAAVALLVVISIPWGRVTGAYDLTPDSRKLAVKWIERNIPAGSKILVPVELGLDTRTLENKYEIITQPVKWLSFGELEEVLRANQDSYMLLPRYGKDPRWAERHVRPPELNAFLRAKFKSIKNFGRRVVLENYNKPVVNGDPFFSIGTIKDEKRW